MQGNKTLCHPSAILSGMETSSVLTRAIYIAALSIYFFSWISQWLSHADRVLTLDMSFHCFGALGIGPGAWTWLHVLAWRIGMIIAMMKSNQLDMTLDNTNFFSRHCSLDTTNILHLASWRLCVTTKCLSQNFCHTQTFSLCKMSICS